MTTRLTLRSIAAIAILGVASTLTVALPASASDDRPVWESLGPDSSGGIVGSSLGRLQTLQQDPGVLWSSDDDGATWSTLRTLPEYQSAVSLVTDPKDADHVLVGTHMPVFAGGGGSLLETRDNGATWHPLTEWELGSANTLFSVVTSDDLQTIVILEAEGVLVSRDAGAHWRHIALDIDPSCLVPVEGRIALSGSDVYLMKPCTGDQLYAVRGIDNRKPRVETLTIREKDTRGDDLRRIAALDGDLYLATSDRVLSSANGGRSWRAEFETAGPEDGLSALAVIEGSLHAASAEGLRIGRRGDGWQTFGVPDYGLGQAFTSMRARFDRDGEVDGTIVSVNGVGVWLSPSPGAYELVGISATELRDLTIAGAGDGAQLLASGGDQVYRTDLPVGAVDAATRRWARTADAEDRVRVNRRVLSGTPGSGVVWVVSRSGYGVDVQISEDAGRTWSIAGGTPNGSFLAAAAAGDDTLFLLVEPVGAAPELWVTRDRGATWERAGEAAPAARGLAVDPTDPRILWATVPDVGGDEAVQRSLDGGRTWESVTVELDGSAMGVRVLGDGTIFVLTTGPLLRSTDGGASFDAVFSSDFTRVNDVVVDPRDPQRLYAAVSGWDGYAVIVSSDGGQTWQPLGTTEGLTVPEAISLVVDPSGRYLYVGTTLGESYRLRLR